MQQNFQFDYPVTDFGTNPASFVGNLEIRATAIIGREEQILKVKIEAICFFDGGRIASHIQKIIKAISPLTYKEIEQAAMEHFKGLKEVAI